MGVAFAAPFALLPPFLGIEDWLSKTPALAACPHLRRMLDQRIENERAGHGHRSFYLAKL
jgi:hypothetical protein